MPTEIEHVEFTDVDVVPVVNRLAGAAWVNLDPAVEPDDVPPARGALGALFSGRGPDIPRATWVAAAGREPVTIGVQHGTGRRVTAVLAEYGLGVPEAWTIVQDHPRRGFVAALPDGDGHPAATLEWLLAAATALATVPLTGRWRAEIHRR